VSDLSKSQIEEEEIKEDGRGPRVSDEDAFPSARDESKMMETGEAEDNLKEKLVLTPPKSPDLMMGKS
jgi:hypothetical protein